MSSSSPSSPMSSTWAPTRDLQLLHQQLNTSMQQTSMLEADLNMANERLQLQYQEISALRAKNEQLEAELQRSKSREVGTRRRHHESLHRQHQLLEVLQGRVRALDDFVGQCLDKSAEASEKA